MIGLILAEDDEVFRLGLRISLEQTPDMRLLAICEDGQTAIEAVSTHLPDIVLMDLGLPIMDGIEATRRIKEQSPQVKVIALTSHTDMQTVNTILSAGASGYAVKGIATQRLLAMIRDVAQGVFWVDSAVSQQLQPSFLFPSLSPVDLASPAALQAPKAADNGPLASLTERELEIFTLISQGLSNPQIAQQCCISHGTVRVHVHAILRKLNVRDRTQAVLNYAPALTS